VNVPVFHDYSFFSSQCYCGATFSGKGKPTDTEYQTAKAAEREHYETCETGKAMARTKDKCGVFSLPEGAEPANLITESDDATR
jgi:hypothetical protein